jgi:prolyl-tRNA editing enzyme YbaK/EbsC (Cys-tRNA(Pro) deacylase)
MWPEPVERIAAFLRASEALGRIEELPPGIDTPPGEAVRVTAFECDGRLLVVLAPGEHELDRTRVARFGGCSDLRPVPPPSFPFQGARVAVDRLLLTFPTVWLEAGSPRHVLGLPPDQLQRLTEAETGVFLRDD